VEFIGLKLRPSEGFNQYSDIEIKFDFFSAGNFLCLPLVKGIPS